MQGCRHRGCKGQGAPRARWHLPGMACSSQLCCHGAWSAWSAWPCRLLQAPNLCTCLIFCKRLNNALFWWCPNKNR